MPTQEQLNEMWAWYQARKTQQLSYPVDEASKNAIGALLSAGPGSTSLTQVYTDSNGDTVTAPKAYAGSLVINAGGALYEIGYIKAL